jgi:hypothetical protein
LNEGDKVTTYKNYPLWPSPSNSPQRQLNDLSGGDNKTDEGTHDCLTAPPKAWDWLDIEDVGNGIVDHNSVKLCIAWLIFGGNKRSHRNLLTNSGGNHVCGPLVIVSTNKFARTDVDRFIINFSSIVKPYSRFLDPEGQF